MHTNMILVYLFSRFGDTGDGLESEASTYSLPAPDFPVSVPDYENGQYSPLPSKEVNKGLSGYGLSDEAIGEEYLYGDGASSASSHSSTGVNNSKYFDGDRSGSIEYNKHPQTLKSASQRNGPPAGKPSYMGGTSSNKGKRFSTLSPHGSGNLSPGDRVHGARSQKENSRGDFQYYAYKRTSIMDHELPAYNKR